MMKLFHDKVLVNDALVLTEDNMNEISKDKKIKILYELFISLFDDDVKNKFNTLLKMSNNNYLFVIKQLFKEIDIDVK